jgi:hypothetical protein
MTSISPTGSDSVQILAVYLGLIEAEFRVDEPAELADCLRAT